VAGPLLAGLLGFGLVGALHTQGHFVHAEWFPYLLWGLLPLGLAWRYRSGAPPAAGERREGLTAASLFGSLLLYLLASPTMHPGFYFLHWPPRAEAVGFLGSDLARFLALTAILAPLLLVKRLRPGYVVLAVLVVGQFECARALWNETGGAALYRDDHPSFMLRLWTAARTIPQWLIYDPLWNGGRVHAFLLATGTVPIATVLWPLWRFGDVLQVYTPGLILAFVVCVPLMAAGSARLMGGRAVACWTTALLAMGVSPYFFKWLLHFGTLGSSFSVAFIMPVVACLYRVLWLDRREVWCGVVLVVSAFFFLSWPPAAFMAVPLGLGLACSARRFTARKWGWLAACAVALLACYIPYVLGLFRHTNVGRFVQYERGSAALGEAIGTGWEQAKELLYGLHPLLLFFGFLGAWFAPHRGVRRLVGPALLGLFVLAGWGEVWKPQFSLSRAMLPLAFLCTLPAGLWVGRLMSERLPRRLPMGAAALSLLLLGGFNTARLYGNEGHAKYVTRPDYMERLVAWLRSNVPEHTRVLFAGPTIHAFGGGHVAYLPVETGREMMACDYYHFSPRMVEYAYPPRPFRASRAGLSEFMELYNVSHVLTYHRRWVRELRGFPEDYREVARFGDRLPIYVFRVLRNGTLFLRGEGSVAAKLNRMDVQVADPNEEVVLKYHWHDELRVSPPAAMRPFPVGNDITFIAVEPNGQRAFTIRYAKWL